MEQQFIGIGHVKRNHDNTWGHYDVPKGSEDFGGRVDDLST